MHFKTLKLLYILLRDMYQINEFKEVNSYILSAIKVNNLI